MAAGNSTYTKLVTTTLQNHGKEIFDAVSENNPLFYMLSKRGNVRMAGGGRTFTHPIIYKQNPSFGSYAKNGTISTPENDDITRAEYAIKAIAGSLVINKMDEAMNSGSREQLIQLAREVKESADISMKKVMGEQVWKDGTESNDMDGLRYLIPDAPSSASDIGGINPSTTGNDYWRAYLGTSISDFNTSNEGVNNMNAAVLGATFGSEGPTAVITTKTVYAYYELSLTGTIRHLKTELGDSGFMHLAYKTMPVLFDDNCPSGHMYFVDLNNIRLQILARGNFRVTDFKDSINQLNKIALMYTFCNLTSGSLRTNAIITSVAD